MTAHELYFEATKRGLRLEPAGDRLAVYPKGACPPDFAETLRQHKGELLDWLSNPPCPGWQVVPPDSLPLAMVPPRPTRENRERTISYLVRQTGNRTGPLTAWLVQRENAYYEGPGRTWDCGLICYAAACDAACWQLRCGEADVWERLQGFEDTAADGNWFNP